MKTPDKLINELDRQDREATKDPDGETKVKLKVISAVFSILYLAIIIFVIIIREDVFTAVYNPISQAVLLIAILAVIGFKACYDLPKVKRWARIYLIIHGILILPIALLFILGMFVGFAYAGGGNVILPLIAIVSIIFLYALYSLCFHKDIRQIFAKQKLNGSTNKK